MRGRSEKSEPTRSTHPHGAKNWAEETEIVWKQAETIVHTNRIACVGRCIFITAFRLEIHSREDLSRQRRAFFEALWEAAGDRWTSLLLIQQSAPARQFDALRGFAVLSVV